MVSFPWMFKKTCLRKFMNGQLTLIRLAFMMGEKNYTKNLEFSAQFFLSEVLTKKFMYCVNS